MQVKFLKGEDHFWSFPFSYGANLLILVSLWIIGFLIEYLTWGRGVVVPPFPYNIICLFILFIFLSLIRNLKLGVWPTTIPFSIVSVLGFSILLLSAAIFPQPIHEPIGYLKAFGFSHITRSWPYAFNLLLIISSLFLVTLKNLKSWGFVANHLGLLIALVGGSFGYGDFVRVKMDLELSKVSYEAYDFNNRRAVMPFALKLLHFNMEEYQPKLVIIDPLKNIPHPEFIKKSWPFKEGQELMIEGVSVKVLKYYPIAIASLGVINQHYGPGSAPVALLQVNNTEGVVTFGSTMMKPSFINLKEGLSLALAIPKPKYFSSEIEYLMAETKERGVIKTEVNHPVNLSGWKIYQYGYDEKMGRWSDKSIIEAIFDPWLPVTYFGIFLMMIGTIHLLLFNKREKR